MRKCTYESSQEIGRIIIQLIQSLSYQIHENVSTVIANENLVLLPEKAIFLPDYYYLLIADLHFGKIEHFRKNGIGLPPKAARKGIQNLKKLIEKVQPQKVIFLGDLFHSEFNDAWGAFKEMLNRFPSVVFHLIIGNHDILDESIYEGLELSYQLEINKLLLTHEPLEVIQEGNYNLCGHIHPGIRMVGKGRQSLRLPCFYFGKELGIMPAFGTFTGIHVLKPLKTDKVFVVNEDLVLEL